MCPDFSYPGHLSVSVYKRAMARKTTGRNWRFRFALCICAESVPEWIGLLLLLQGRQTQSQLAIGHTHSMSAATPWGLRQLVSNFDLGLASVLESRLCQIWVACRSAVHVPCYRQTHGAIFTSLRSQVVIAVHCMHNSTYLPLLCTLLDCRFLTRVSLLVKFRSFSQAFSLHGRVACDEILLHSRKHSYLAFANSAV